jgi:hypothetical protein
VKLLGVLYILLSALGLCAALFLMLTVATAAEPHEAAVALPIIGINGTALVAFLPLLFARPVISG